MRHALEHPAHLNWISIYLLGRSITTLFLEVKNIGGVIIAPYSGGARIECPSVLTGVAIALRWSPMLLGCGILLRNVFWCMILKKG